MRPHGLGGTVPGIDHTGWRVAATPSWYLVFGLLDVRQHAPYLGGDGGLPFALAFGHRFDAFDHLGVGAAGYGVLDVNQPEIEAMAEYEV